MRGASTPIAAAKAGEVRMGAAGPFSDGPQVQCYNSAAILRAATA